MCGLFAIVCEYVHNNISTMSTLLTIASLKADGSHPATSRLPMPFAKPSAQVS